MKSELEQSIKSNFDLVKQRISASALLSGRKPEEIKLIVVTKSQSIEKIQAAIELGITDFGENYPEETAQKINLLNKNKSLHWHMIGHLQSRKIPLVCQHFDVFHALDSLSLAQKLTSKLEQINKDLPVLLEINIADELTKSGWRISDEVLLRNLIEDVTLLAQLSHLKIIGLMAIPPLNEDENVTRSYMRKIRELRDALQLKIPTLHLKELSLGTSLDYEIAIQEGSTMVRIGEAILGSRIKQI